MSTKMIADELQGAQEKIKVLGAILDLYDARIEAGERATKIDWDAVESMIQMRRQVVKRWWTVRELHYHNITKGGKSYGSDVEGF